MIALLRQVERGGEAWRTSRRLLAAAGASPGEEDERCLIEPLTTREIEVLGTLRSRLSNQEIADRLEISVFTVKRHTVNIYQKLAVGGRRQAVVEAERLGLI